LEGDAITMHIAIQGCEEIGYRSPKATFREDRESSKETA